MKVKRNTLLLLACLVFYTGLGASLLLAGLLLGRNFGRALHAAAELQNKTEHEGE